MEGEAGLSQLLCLRDAHAGSLSDISLGFSGFGVCSLPGEEWWMSRNGTPSSYAFLCLLLSLPIPVETCLAHSLTITTALKVWIVKAKEVWEYLNIPSQNSVSFQVGVYCCGQSKKFEQPLLGKRAAFPCWKCFRALLQLTLIIFV